jgi:hypothetical protein
MLSSYCPSTTHCHRNPYRLVNCVRKPCARQGLGPETHRLMLNELPASMLTETVTVVTVASVGNSRASALQ